MNDVSVARLTGENDAAAIRRALEEGKPFLLAPGATFKPSLPMGALIRFSAPVPKARETAPSLLPST